MAMRGVLNSEEPFKKAVAVTKSDVTVLTKTDALYVGGAGAVAVTMEGGSSVVFAAVPAGTILRISATQVLSTGTAATDILALYL